MRKYLSLIILMFSVSANADTLNIVSKAAIASGAGNTFAVEVYRNPALNRWRSAPTVTNVCGRLHVRKESAPQVVQLGDGSVGGVFAVESSAGIEQGRVWGNALYSNTQVRNVLYNATADYLLLAPYVMADTVGGDLKEQVYSFGGGFAKQVSERITVGLDADFRAHSEYRQIDPRPYNVATELNVSAGAAYAAPVCILGLAATANKYKQTNNLKFFSELGQPMVVHLTGLGNRYQRFDNRTDVYYNGFAVGGNLSALDVNAKWGAIASVNYRKVEKVLVNLNNLPIMHLTEFAVSGEAFYNMSASSAVRLRASHAKRTGTEYIFGDVSSDVYVQISDNSLYTRNTSGVSAAAYWQWSAQGGVWHAEPQLMAHMESEEYAYPRSEMSVVNAGAGVRLGRKWLAAAQALKLYIDAEYWTNVDSKEQLARYSTWQKPVVSNYNMLGCNRCAVGASAYWIRQISARHAITAQAIYRAALYSAGTMHNFQLSVGVAF